MLYLRAIICLLGLIVSTASVALETVTLQLKWKHQFQFAGYYAALEKGFYKDAGLAVIIREPSMEQDPIQSVLDGHAEYGVGTSELLLVHNKGGPVVVLGVIFQHSPLALVVSQSNNILNIHDLVNKSLMIEPNSAELFAYFAREGVTKDRITIEHHSFDVQDLVKGNVDGMSVYTTDEPYALKQANFAYTLFEPSVGGIDFYGDNLFTTKKELRENPDRVEAFRQASIKGWKYAMDHPEELIDLIYERYSQRHTKGHLAFEAEAMKRLLQPSLVEPGYMHEGRWQHIADTYAQQKLLPMDYDLAGFLYRPEKGLDVGKVRQWGLALLLVSALIFCVLVYVWRLNRRLEDSQMWLKSIVTSAPSALMVLDDRAQVLDWNKQAELTFGWGLSEVKGRSIYDFLIPESDKNLVQDILCSVMKSGEVKASQNWNLTKGGQRILCDWRNVVPQANTLVCMANDITDRKKTENKLREMAHTDALTRVANRTLFFEKMEQSIHLAKRQNEKIALLFIDLDDFKIVNDRYGHEVGDVVLCEVVQRIKMAVREADLLARIGGDEFVLMLYNCESTGYAKQVAEKVISTLEKPIQVAGIKVTIGGSIGISMYPANGEKVSDILKAADRAMYVVKEKEKNGVGVAKSKSSAS